jgi:hypothetical protein
MAVTALTADVWANGSLSSGSSVNWYRFTATAATQYLHGRSFSGSTGIASVGVLIYDSVTCDTVGS